MSELARRHDVGGGGELIDAFEARALTIAASAAAQNTRRAYATSYRFAGFLRARYGEASVERVTVAAVAARRDHLKTEGLAPSSVAQRVCAVRRLAAAIGADPLVAQVRCSQVQQERPAALSDLELSQQHVAQQQLSRLTTTFAVTQVDRDFRQASSSSPGMRSGARHAGNVAGGARWARAPPRWSQAAAPFPRSGAYRPEGSSPACSNSFRTGTYNTFADRRRCPREG